MTTRDIDQKMPLTNWTLHNRAGLLEFGQLVHLNEPVLLKEVIGDRYIRDDYGECELSDGSLFFSMVC